jgi:hypothetical protein
MVSNDGELDYQGGPDSAWLHSGESLFAVAFDPELVWAGFEANADEAGLFASLVVSQGALGPDGRPLYTRLVDWTPVEADGVLVRATMLKRGDEAIICLAAKADDPAQARLFLESSDVTEQGEWSGPAALAASLASPAQAEAELDALKIPPPVP